MNVLAQLPKNIRKEVYLKIISKHKSKFSSIGLKLIESVL